MVERRALYAAFFLGSDERESLDLLGMCLHDWLGFLRGPCHCIDGLGLLLLANTSCPIEDM
jgi:hypothetical protein